MAKSSADDKELCRACEATIEGTKQRVAMSIRVAKTKGAWTKGKIGKGQMSKPKSFVLCVSVLKGMHVAATFTFRDSRCVNFPNFKKDEGYEHNSYYLCCDIIMQLSVLHRGLIYDLQEMYFFLVAPSSSLHFLLYLRITGEDEFQIPRVHTITPLMLTWGFLLLFLRWMFDPKTLIGR